MKNELTLVSSVSLLFNIGLLWLDVDSRYQFRGYGRLSGKYYSSIYENSSIGSHRSPEGHNENEIKTWINSSVDQLNKINWSLAML